MKSFYLILLYVFTIVNHGVISSKINKLKGAYEGNNTQRLNSSSNSSKVDVLARNNTVAAEAKSKVAIVVSNLKKAEDNLPGIEEMTKSFKSDTIQGSLTKINKFLYSLMNHSNQTLVIYNQMLQIQNLTKETKIDKGNGQSIGVHDFSKEPPLKQFLRSFVLNFFSEMGDKSFFCVVVFFNQVSPLFLFFIAVFAELLMNFISVVIGYEMTGNFSVRFFKLVGMWVFIFFGLMTFYEIFFAKDEEESEKDEAEEKSTLCSTESQHEQEKNSLKDIVGTYIKSGLKVFGMIFVAELGDKSQITTIILTTEYTPVWIFLGTALAHVAGILISMIIGYIVSNKINIKMINVIGAIAFVVMGLEMGINYYRNPIDF